MKIYSNYVDVKLFEKEFKDLSHLDFSLFFEYRPNARELAQSSINIYGLEEPNEYTGNHDWAIQNQHAFDFILTWSDRMLKKCENAILSPFGNSWLHTKDLHLTKYNKKFEVSFLRGMLLKTYGHSLRHELYNREDEISVPHRFFDKTEPRDTFDDYVEGKLYVLRDSMYSVIIENTSHHNYFTEKIIDCMLLRTIPIYWGCSNIGDYFNKTGILCFQNIDEGIDVINSITPEFYEKNLDVIEENYQLALKYTNHILTIKQQIIDIFKLNNLL
jgi:hypothetical protein